MQTRKCVVLVPVQVTMIVENDIGDNVSPCPRFGGIKMPTEMEVLSAYNSGYHFPTLEDAKKRLDK